MAREWKKGLHELITDTAAYVPFALIGIFILLLSLMLAFDLTRMDYQLAEIVYSSDVSDPQHDILDMACADISRCLNYAGMEALEWRGEHPVIQPEYTSVGSWSNKGYEARPLNKDVEPGDVLQVKVELPSNILGALLSLISNKDRVLTVYDESGSFNMSFNYNGSHSLWGSSSFVQELKIPADASYGLGSVVLRVGNDVQATDWFHVGTNPIKDIVAARFNELMKNNYRNGVHRTGRYVLDVNEDISPEQIIIGKVNGTLSRSIPQDHKDYVIHYTLTIKQLNYTLTDIDTGIKTNGSMDIFTPVDSREPLLAQLTSEYERELNTGVVPDIVLGLSNVRSFIYGPWQHYAGGPLNILTGPSIAGAVNAGTIYGQKQIFDAVDPWSLMYTGYYNGKTLYRDLKRDTSDYDQQKGDLSTVYTGFATSGSFNMDMEQSIDGSMKDAGTSLQSVEDASSVTIAVSNYTAAVKNGWMFNDQVWGPEDPDLIHNVTRMIYSAEVMPEISRSGVNDRPEVHDIQVETFFDPSTVNMRMSFSFYYLTWDAEYLVSLWHEGAIVPGYFFENRSRISYSEKIMKPSYIADLDIANWQITNARLEHQSTSLENLRITPLMKYAGNDTLLGMEREGGFLNSESRSFDWDIEYVIEFDIYSQWELKYDYAYTHTGVIDNNHDVERLGTFGHVQQTHKELEKENITFVYHKCFRTSTYDGLAEYEQTIGNEFRDTVVTVGNAQLTDTCCSDAADKYREAYVDIAQIEKEYEMFSDGTKMPRRIVKCDVPIWLPSLMTEDLLSMLREMDDTGPSRTVYLMGDNLGRNPADLFCDAAEDMALEMENERELYVQAESHFTGNDFTTSSDAARMIAKNESYEKTIQRLVDSNANVKSSLDGYLNDVFSERTGAAFYDLLGGLSPSELLFNNPALSMATNAMAQDMGVIDTMKVVGWPHSKYSWTENMTLLVDQYPDYLYHDEGFDLQEQFIWEDGVTGKTIYPLAVRNTCIFSGDVSGEVADIMKGCTDPVKTTVSRQMSSSILEVNSQVNDVITQIGNEAANLTQAGVSTDVRMLKDEQTRLMNAYAGQLRIDIPGQISDQVAADPELSACIDPGQVEAITRQYLDSLNNEQLVAMTSDDTLALELFNLFKSHINANSAAIDGKVDIALLRLEADMHMGVSDGVCATIDVCHEIIDECFSNIDKELQNKLDDSASKLTGKSAEKVGERLEKAMRCVPAGLPLLPPNWVCTVNIWEYEVKGMYKRFIVVDMDNECIVDPFFGHKAQMYVREKASIRHPSKKNSDGTSIFLGDNEPICFEFTGYSATIVGPGPKGVGDKFGGREEKSTSYDIFESQF
ncbi:MAG: hypothetical protein WBL02_03055 [Methanomethylovorans sp.]|uniref:DUF7286 family protein n=1 Tax=Methanomethylovorans sp. TaxID=2758717 RepID=UPI003C791558